jgi:hypothetical protein
VDSWTRVVFALMKHAPAYESRKAVETQYAAGLHLLRLHIAAAFQTRQPAISIVNPIR